MCEEEFPRETNWFLLFFDETFTAEAVDQVFMLAPGECIDKHREVELANDIRGLKTCSSFPANQTLPLPPNGWACAVL